MIRLIGIFAVIWKDIVIICRYFSKYRTFPCGHMRTRGGWHSWKTWQISRSVRVCWLSLRARNREKLLVWELSSLKARRYSWQSRSKSLSFLWYRSDGNTTGLFERLLFGLPCLGNIVRLAISNCILRPFQEVKVTSPHLMICLFFQISSSLVHVCLKCNGVGTQIQSPKWINYYCCRFQLNFAWSQSFQCERQRNYTQKRMN